jgi:filamentous hemagglutinin family protein
MKAHCKIILSMLTSGLASILFNSSIQAQIVPDTTLGTENSLVTPNVVIKGLPSDRIDGGAVRGTNLFHSFGEFHIGEGRGAYFTNPTGIENIISRVTGANPSNIFGKLGVLGGNANLFLINPQGIIFGPNASLDVGGSFVATTASSLNFADGTQFTSQPSQKEPLLTVRVPIGLTFGSSPGNILVQGNGRGTRLTSTLLDTNFGLRVPPKRVLALVGGNVLIEGGTVKSPGGRIEIGSAIGSGTVGIVNLDAENFSFDYTNVPALGEIQLTRQAAVDASGIGGGDIQIQGKKLLLADGSQIESSTLGEELGGMLTINVSDAVDLTGTSAIGRFITPSGISAFVYPGATGSGPNLNIATQSLNLRDGGAISTATLGIGTGGNLSIKADEVKVTGTLIADQRGGGIATSVAPRAVGKAGDLEIRTRRLVVDNGGLVSTTSLGQGTPGNLILRAEESVELVGRANEQTPSSLSARSIGVADAGNITVETQQFNILDGARVNASSSGTGSAGKITLIIRSLQLDRGSVVVETQSGNGGDINLQAQDLLLIRNNSKISATAGIAGNGGDGGNITINTPFIFAVPLENSDTIANAFKGRGGNIDITAQAIFGIQPRNQDTPQSDITASSELGINGTVRINTPDIIPSQGLVNLPEQVIDVSRLVAQGCSGSGGNVGRGTGEFIITGRGGLPPQPGEPLRAEAIVANDDKLVAGEKNRSSSVAAKVPTPSTSTQLVEAQGWLFNNKGEVVLTSQPPNATPDSSGSTQATCYAP